MDFQYFPLAFFILFSSLIPSDKDLNALTFPYTPLQSSIFIYHKKHPMHNMH